MFTARLRSRLTLVCGVLVVGFCAITFLSPVLRKTTGSPRPLSCRLKLQQIGLAIQAYHDTYGAFPPAATRDAEGRLMHSWRSLILPFIPESSLHKHYDNSQPWNSPHNILLAEQVPWFYRCPNVGHGKSGYTPFLAVTGTDAAWSDNESRSSNDFVDGQADTILVLSVPDAAVLWTEPRDIAYPLGQEVIGNTRHSVVNALFADGSVHGLDIGSLLDGRMNAAFTRSSGDQVDRNLLKKPSEHLDSGTDIPW
ncbi:MAG TPA: hypothetical protein DD670_02775 [Planctomycetaceae bacterium]|nr:hypothetical protein [Planctomycetaceae bacterium]